MSDMKKTKKTPKTSNLRVVREAIRLLASTDLDRVAGGRRCNSEHGSCCDMGSCPSEVL